MFFSSISFPRGCFSPNWDCFLFLFYFRMILFDYHMPQTIFIVSSLYSQSHTLFFILKDLPQSLSNSNAYLKSLVSCRMEILVHPWGHHFCSYFSSMFLLASYFNIILICLSVYNKITGTGYFRKKRGFLKLKIVHDWVSHLFGLCLAIWLVTIQWLVSQWGELMQEGWAVCLESSHAEKGNRRRGISMLILSQQPNSASHRN